MWVIASLYLLKFGHLFNDIEQHFSNLFLSSSEPQVEYKYDKEMLKGCVIPVVDDKYTLLCMKNAEMASDVSSPLLYLQLLRICWLTCCKLIFYFISPLQVKYREKYEKGKGQYVPIMDTPQILHAKAVRTLASEVKK